MVDSLGYDIHPLQSKNTPSSQLLHAEGHDTYRPHMCPLQVSQAALATVLLRVLQSNALLLQCEVSLLSLLLQASFTSKGRSW